MVINDRRVLSHVWKIFSRQAIDIIRLELFFLIHFLKRHCPLCGFQGYRNILCANRIIDIRLIKGGDSQFIGHSVISSGTHYTHIKEKEMAHVHLAYEKQDSSYLHPSTVINFFFILINKSLFRRTVLN